MFLWNIRPLVFFVVLVTFQPSFIQASFEGSFEDETSSESSTASESENLYPFSRRFYQADKMEAPSTVLVSTGSRRPERMHSNEATYWKNVLSDKTCQIRSLAFEGMQPQFEDLETLSDGIAENNSLIEFSWAVDFKRAGVPDPNPLLQKISKRKNFEVLMLIDFRVYENESDLVVQLIRNNPSLKKLCLRNNQFEKEGMLKVLDAVSKSEALKEVKLWGTSSIAFNQRILDKASEIRKKFPDLHLETSVYDG